MIDINLIITSVIGFMTLAVPFALVILICEKLVGFTLSMIFGKDVSL